MQPLCGQGLGIQALCASFRDQDFRDQGSLSFTVHERPWDLAYAYTRERAYFPVWCLWLALNAICENTAGCQDLPRERMRAVYGGIILHSPLRV